MAIDLKTLEKAKAWANSAHGRATLEELREELRALSDTAPNSMPPPAPTQGE